MCSTKKIFVFSVIAILNVLTSCHAEIRLIQATIRHGDRNPALDWLNVIYYPNDPHKNCNYAPDGPMELTNAGKKNAFRLGQYLRDRYATVVGPTYDPNRVHFHASRMARTINTAQLIAAGLFRPENYQKWNPHLSWIPIPIYSTPMEEDILNFSLALCENYLIDRIRSEAEVNRILGVISDMHSLYDFLSVNTGVNYTRSVQGWILYHQLAAQVGTGLKLESWTEGIYPNGKLIDIAAIQYIIQTYTGRMKRLVGGIWIKKFLDHIDDFITNKNDHWKADFYASSEIQIAAILNALGVYKAHVPGYVSAVIFELHEIDEDLYVKVVYRNEGLLTEFTIPGCGTSICRLSTFKDALKNVTLSNFEEDCGKRISFSMPLL